MRDTFNYDVFISHSAKDKRMARELAKQLKHDGIKVSSKEKDLQESRTLVLLMSKAAFASEWVTLERHTLMFRDPTNAKRLFIPLLIEECTIPDVIAQFAVIDWRDQSDESYAKLVSACRPEETAVIEPAAAKERVIKASMVLKGHKGVVNDVAVTPDGKRVVSGSNDKTLKLWDLESGRCLATFKGHKGYVNGVVVIPDGKRVVSGSHDNTLKIWGLESGRCLATLKGHRKMVFRVVLTHDGKRIVTGANDSTLKVWDASSGQCLTTLKGHEGLIGRNAAAVTPDGKRAVSGSEDKTLKLWDLESGQCIATFKGHSGMVFGVAVTPDGKRAVSGSGDKTLKLWDLESGQCIATLEGHTDVLLVVAVTPDGKRVVSGSGDKTLKLWDLESGQCIATFEGHLRTVYGLDITPDGKRVVSASSDKTIRVWELPEPDVRVEPFLSTRYTNAKVVLVGESGVGKTGLAIRLAEDRWQVTDSTHGMNVWPLPLPEVETANMEREVWLWDFAGQPDYRLIHQLYMDETALALMMMDPQRDNPFDTLGHWEKALAAAAKHNPAKLLVAGRCDRGGITVSTGKLEQYCQTKEYSTFINTAAKTGDGCEKLKEMICSFIPWERLPWTATTILFKTLKDAVIRIRDEGFVLTRISELRQRLQLELKETIEEKDLRAVVGLIAGQGVVQQLDFGDFVLLQPEQINNYASAVVRCVRENIDEIGCIREQDVLEANIDFKDMQQLSETDEKILVRAMWYRPLSIAPCA